MDSLSLNDVGIAAFSVTVLYVVWKFVDKWLGKIFDLLNGWAGKFYDVQAKQSEAMTVLAHKVTESADDQRNTLVVMRSISASVERLHGEIADDAERTGLVLSRVAQIEADLRKRAEGETL